MLELVDIVSSCTAFHILIQQKRTMFSNKKTGHCSPKTFSVFHVFHHFWKPFGILLESVESSEKLFISRKMAATEETAETVDSLKN